MHITLDTFRSISPCLAMKLLGSLGLAITSGGGEAWMPAIRRNVLTVGKRYYLLQHGDWPSTPLWELAEAHLTEKQVHKGHLAEKQMHTIYWPSPLPAIAVEPLGILVQNGRPGLSGGQRFFCDTRGIRLPHAMFRDISVSALCLGWLSCGNWRCQWSLALAKPLCHHLNKPQKRTM